MTELTDGLQELLPVRLIAEDLERMPLTSHGEIDATRAESPILGRWIEKRGESVRTLARPAAACQKPVTIRRRGKKNGCGSSEPSADFVERRWRDGLPLPGAGLKAPLDEAFYLSAERGEIDRLEHDVVDTAADQSLGQSWLGEPRQNHDYRPRRKPQ